jgi:hypothetical protein
MSLDSPPPAPVPPPSRHLKFRAADGAELRAGFDNVRKEFDLPPDFAPEMLAEAERLASSPRLPELDNTDIPFLTIDPPGSMDLDQAVHIERRGDGYRVRYAIADVAAFVQPGSALDAECHRRVLTLYLPDGRTPLHPPALSEGAASLLPGETDRRRCGLWTSTRRVSRWRSRCAGRWCAAGTGTTTRACSSCSTRAAPTSGCSCWPK